MNQAELTKILPQAYPFLMIDKILEIKPGESLTAIKNITANEWIFQNQHCPIYHLPEPFLIEAAAQAALVLHNVTYRAFLGDDLRYVFGKIDSNFGQKVNVGDQIRIQTLASKMLRNFGYMSTSLYINLDKIAEIIIYYKVLVNFDDN